jgi:hypothetical protein
MDLFETLPNFLIIGAAKAGTTSLHNVLSQHPDIFCSKDKEPRFFTAEDRYARGLKWYQDTYFHNAAVYPRRCESTASYLYWSTVTAPRIKLVYGEHELKLITALRDPVKRAYSFYWMKKHSGEETLSFEDALEYENERLGNNWARLKHSGRDEFGYYRGGCYATLLQPFLELFPRDDLAFVLLEDFQKNFADTMTRLANFLGVQPDFKFRPMLSNPSALPKNPGIDRFLHHPSGLLHQLLKPFTHQLPYTFRDRLKKRLIHSNWHPVSYPPMNTETERQLRGRYGEEIERLESILGCDLSSWKTV